MMKILVLDHPRIASEKRFNDIANTPLWSCLMGGYAAAALEKNGFDTLFLDAAQPGTSFETTALEIQSHGPDLLCVNAVYFWEHTQKLFDFLSALKQQGLSCHLNLFGFFPSLIYRSILTACLFVDSIAVGEFEHTLVELARAVENHQALDSIHGLATAACLADNKSRMRRPEKNPDVFAFPKRTALEGTINILGSRGCYNHCSFCPVPSFYNQGSLWRGRSPRHIADEIKQIIDQGGRSFYFCDPNFVGPGATGKKRIMELMRFLKPLNIRFGMETRPQDLDDEIMESLVGAGFESLLMGIESGSGAVLKRIDKSSGTGQSSEAIALCRRHGIEPEIGFLMFVPDSHLTDLGENMRFLADNDLLDRLDRTANLLSHTQIVLAGTSGYDRFEENGQLIKTGIFGFEGRVRFSDPSVRWVADLLTFGCHAILKSMADSDSPIFWQKEDPQTSREANDFLVTLSHALIERAGYADADTGQNGIETEQEQILAQIHDILYR